MGKRVVFAMVASCVLVITTPSLAQEKPNNGALGADAAVLLPVGDWRGGGANVGFGALAYGDMRFVGDLSLTLRAGYVYHLPRTEFPDDASYRHVEVLAGGKYRFGGPYVAAEAGIVWVTLHTEPYIIQSYGGPYDFPGHRATESDLGATGGVGYEFGDFDLRAQVLFPAVTKSSEWMAVMATAGYRFLHF